MASYRIKWRPSTKKDLKRISKSEALKIIEAVEALSVNPRPSGVKKLFGSEFTYRIRKGNYRIIYEIHDETIVIEVVKVGHRKVYTARANKSIDINRFSCAKSVSHLSVGEVKL